VCENDFILKKVTQSEIKIIKINRLRLEDTAN
jgi:hypothetical protein